MLDSRNLNSARSSVIEGGAPAVLNDIRRPECEAVIWQRALSPVFNQWLASVHLETLSSARISARWTTLEKAAVELCHACGLPEGRGRSLLASDVAQLAQLLMDAAETNTLNLRLDVVSGNACHKFHQDYVTARLLCTYRGAGTQYGHAGADRIPDTVHQMNEGQVGIFRGRLCSGGQETSLLHRSPPIEGSGERRLLLVIDPQDND